MRKTFISTLCALLLCLAICVASLLIIRGSVDEMTALCAAAEEAQNRGNADEAATLLSGAGDYWERKRRIMEIVVSHDTLMRVSEAQVEALGLLTGSGIHEFERAMAVLHNALSDVYDRETPTITNIF